MNPRAFVAGLSGLELTGDERAFFRQADPFGFILFRRNVESPDQVRALTDSLRSLTGRADLPILVDQEGGRVQRLGPPHWPRYPAARAYSSGVGGRLAPSEAARLGARLIAHDLRSVGITVDCLPVLDVPAPGSHDIIGDRAYAGGPELVSELGGQAAAGLLSGGVLPVMKHIPGHGRAGADSHAELPRVAASLEALRGRDFQPFRRLAHLPLAMTAHVVFEAIDPERPATLSPVVIHEIIREEIGFGGLLLSDDLSMHALSGDFRSRAESALVAGCDVVLHCNGDLGEMEAVAAAALRLSGPSWSRADKTLTLMRTGAEDDGFDPVDARKRLDACLAAMA